MLTASVDLQGLPGLNATIASLYTMPSMLMAMVQERAREGAERLAAATNVDTGAAQAGWHWFTIDATSAAIVNRATNRGYSYPTGLITGTGARAVPTAGFTGGHRASWPGMSPSITLRPAWEREITIGFTLPASLVGVP